MSLLRPGPRYDPTRSARQSRCVILLSLRFLHPRLLRIAPVVQRPCAISLHSSRRLPRRRPRTLSVLHPDHHATVQSNLRQGRCCQVQIASARPSRHVKLLNSRFKPHRPRPIVCAMGASDVTVTDFTLSSCSVSRRLSSTWCKGVPLALSNFSATRSDRQFGKPREALQLNRNFPSSCMVVQHPRQAWLSWLLLKIHQA
mmetsp:Transcript_19443/g.57879  ORF Transcript_19443/g.57879 Transcript_19443/m.57879 type:complete len:200 (+) Transcript_19443:4709-5308(+)